MRVVADGTIADVDITSLAEIGSFVASGLMLLVLRATLDNLGEAGGEYVVRILVNGVPLLPDSTITVPASLALVSFQSRELAVDSDDTVSIQALGATGDTAVSATVLVIDVSPISSSNVEADISPAVVEAVTESLALLEIRPERTVLGPCRSSTTSTPSFSRL